MNNDNAYVIKVDYGSDSVRSIIVNVKDGFEVASSVFYYPRWKDAIVLRCFESKIYHFVIHHQISNIKSHS